jgi:hypothetical protein
MDFIYLMGFVNSRVVFYKSKTKMSKTIDITLTKEEWSNVETWVNSASRMTFERSSKEWFEELYTIVKDFYMPLYFSDDMSAMNIPIFSNHTLTMERRYFRYLVFSVGRIAYDFDVKTPTAQMAYNIVTKLEKQGDKGWIKNRW